MHTTDNGDGTFTHTLTAADAQAVLTEHLLTYTQAMQHAGLSERSLYRGINRLHIPVYQDTRDRRIKMVKRSDAERIAASIKPRRRRKG